MAAPLPQIQADTHVVCADESDGARHVIGPLIDGWHWRARIVVHPDRRVEVVVPIIDAEIKNYLKETVLDAYLRDEVNARLLRTDGTYRKVGRRGSGGPDAQMGFVGLGLPF